MGKGPEAGVERQSIPSPGPVPERPGGGGHCLFRGHFSCLEPGGVTLLAGKPGFDGLWCGSDESGKGDYFGPLAVAAVCLDLAAARQYAPGAFVTARP